MYFPNLVGKKRRDLNKISGIRRTGTIYRTLRIEKLQPEDEVPGPRQILERPNWVADKGVQCDPTQWSGKNLSRAFHGANARLRFVLSGQ